MKKYSVKFLIIFAIIVFAFLPKIVNAEDIGLRLLSNGKLVYYLENGDVYRGFKDIDGKKYFFSYTNGQTKTGWQVLNDKWFYCNNDGTVITNQITIIDGQKYYFDNEGYRYSGFKDVGTKKYFFSYVNGQMKTGWQVLNGKWFYCNNDGTVEHSGLTVMPSGNKYFFQEDGYRYDGFKDIDGKKYFFSYTNGKTKTGWQVLNGKWFYCNSDGTVVTNEALINDKTYYFDSDGFRYTGWKTLENGKKLYINDGLALTGFHNINGKTYYFSKVNNVMLSGWQVLNGKWFYCEEDGVVVTGFKTIDGNLYYFSKVSYFKLTGWQVLNSKWFYCDKDGIVAQEQKTINGKVYYFDENYFRYTGWKTLENGKKLYINDGLALVGFHNIDGKTYYFSKVNNVMLTGWQVLNGNSWFYCEADGTVVTGFKTIDGNLYYFSKVNHFKLIGWQMLGNDKWFYCDQDGVVATNVTKEINGMKYKFTSTGFIEGFYYNNGKMYYKNPDGVLLKGTQRMCSRYFKFNSSTGAFEGYAVIHQVIDVSQNQGKINWNAVNYDPSVDAVIVRLGYGSQYVDTYYHYNITSLNGLGIPYSVYLFSYALDAAGAAAEANFLVNTIRNTPNLHLAPQLAIYYDLESWAYVNHPEINSNGISAATYHDIITTFVSIVERELGKKTRIYTDLNHINNRFYSSDAGYVGWVAQWPDNRPGYYTNVDSCSYKGLYDGWQYTRKGTVSGIGTYVDRSLFYY